MPSRFRDRRDAGRRLAADLREYAHRDDVRVLALPRGGVPVAYEVARALDAPLDVFVVRKLGLPGHEEYAMGAIATGGVVLVSDEVVRRFGVSAAQVDSVIEAERRELERRERRYRGDRPRPAIAGKTVILIDDGLATGASMWAAVGALEQERPAHIVVAVPIASPETCDAFRDAVDDVVCAEMPDPFHAVGLWYEDFSQTTDEEVHALLDEAARAHGGRRASPAGGGAMHTNADEWTVHVSAGTVTLEGTLGVPEGASGVVLFAHGSGSSRHSPRNRYVARVLREGGLATLLLDLLTSDEETVDLRTRALRFDIGLLAERLAGTIDWLAEQRETHDLPVGLFGASTGGGAALVAAAERPERVRAVVSRGGRPDLAGNALEVVQAPTLLLVGGRDHPVIALNEQAMARMLAATPRPEVQLTIVPGATHLFEEPGTLEAVARIARAWFADHLALAHAGARHAGLLERRQKE